MPDFLLTTLAVCIGLSSLLNYLKDGDHHGVSFSLHYCWRCFIKDLLQVTEGVVSNKKMMQL